MEDFESVVEEYDNKLEEKDEEMSGNTGDFNYVETVTIVKVN